MKYVTILITLVLSCYLAVGQKYFKYNEYQRYLGTTYYRTEPLFEYEKFDTTGKANAVYIYNYRDLYTSLEQAIESALALDSINVSTKTEARNYANARTYIKITVDYTGKIYDVKFELGESDRKILTDERLYKIYQAVKKIKINMKEVDINVTGPYRLRGKTYNMYTFATFYWYKK